MSRPTRSLVALVAVLLALPVFASAAHSGNLKPGFCQVRDFDGPGMFNGAVTHSSKSNDLYQVICETGGDPCWAFSINLGNGGTQLATGLWNVAYEWWICSYSDNKGKTKYQAIASVQGANTVRFDHEQFGPAREVAMSEAPASLRGMVERLELSR